MATDKSINVDRGESISLMEPLIISSGSKYREELSDLAIQLASISAGLSNSLPEGILGALANLVRSMNCYYSNLIEGHNTHPIDIERALKQDFSADVQQRNLQVEATAHIAVQQWIDDGGLTSKPVAVETLLEIHRRFCELLPDDLLLVKNPETGEQLPIVPGQFRQHDVKAGRHVPPSSGALPRFVARFEKAYHALGKSETIIATAAAHHRLLCIHPFLDGNGRVARLVSYAMLLDALDSRGIWSIARGLARNVETYKSLLAQCDLARRNDLDGRGNLSEEALVQFTRFFLESCIDQVTFMKDLMQPERLRHRILIWAEEEVRMGELPAKVNHILEAILYRGVLYRKDIPAILGLGERQARRLVTALVDREVLISKSPRGPLYLAFPASLASRWMPGLFPER